MRLTNQQLNKKLNEIKVLVENEELEDACKEYKRIESYIDNISEAISGENQFDREEVAEFYASYAYFLFALSEYEQFFEMYIKAQNYGYSCEKRINFIFEAFVQPNLCDFMSNYEINRKNMFVNGCLNESLEFSELPYWLLTSGNENEYYLFEKESNLIKEKFEWNLSEFSCNEEITLDSSACDQLIIGCDSWSEFQGYLKNSSMKGKKTYYVEANIKELLTCLQGGIISELYLSKFILFENNEDLKKYFINHSDYLPRKIIGIDEEKAKYKINIEKIHQLRLKKENRGGDNILLSIGIPSFNRGKRAYNNVIHTLLSNFDEEIEVVISNNGTQNETKDLYEKISLIEDARVTYFEFDKNQGVALNICKVIDLAHGKYVLMISDEDLVDLNKLKEIVNMLNRIKDNNIAEIRTKTDGMGIVPFIGIAKPGMDALNKFMLTSNYMTGIIYKKEIIEKYDLLDYIRLHLNNETCFYYPHVVMELILCQYGSILGLDMVLVNEGRPEKTEVEYAEIGEKLNKTIPYYATLEGRIKQHKGFFDIIREMEISKNNFDAFRQLYLTLCRKTIYLVNLSICVNYRETDINTDKLLKSAYDAVMKYFDEIYYGKKNSNKYKFVEDTAEIKKYYSYFINQSR
ncbi:glycosyltransferase family 2 protein [Acetobacterium tundrae]|uniref:Glycosyltransferase n=1 Tax=Acetobacterium tundrae TaxID=132932 RepID=A0ABR6WLP6_9FIRM|nr:glycosyltransferase [Acetobacterium tundrae]MBC3797052.1 glycosyltransferase [Acetobacterium tundrae]